MDNEEKNQATEDETKKSTDQNVDNSADVDGQESEDKSVDSDKVVEKLKGRIGKMTAEKSDTEQKLADALKTIEDLKSGKKDVKKLSQDDKAKQEQVAKDSKIQELEDKLKLSEAKSQTDSVFKEAGLNVNSDVLNMVVSTDDETTYSNAKSLIDFANSIQESTRSEFMAGKTPKVSGAVAKQVTQDEFNSMSYFDKAKLMKDDPTQFTKLTGGY
ncbi:capsid assembly scaffolding protein Gp46 family protein [Companilactobacillus nodensis]|uniref:Scaffolding protein n=1 Tax=Companilactobacillus nodensis DSM 19682 = JCM 14932 = NBRC 107160 TaxID=1423775 RepID=A0A0R1K990_9LACO|nr:DUF4355 domain-containing protein [Companilactobacillus nodensis]KRK80221.1 hypothetical protein FD03_GL002610 [Companilactobacillus nodensis DSM 19682 = JCM 14932 = NBRC 107160]